jgi:hypothetical protein
MAELIDIMQAFLGMNFALTGVPLGLFILFTITVGLFALIVGLILGLLAAVVCILFALSVAVIFIAFATGTALCFVLPVIFFTTMSATFLFLWGLGGYYILKWANGGKCYPSTQHPDDHNALCNPSMLAK